MTARGTPIRIASQRDQSNLSKGKKPSTPWLRRLMPAARNLHSGNPLFCPCDYAAEEAAVANSMKDAMAQIAREEAPKAESDQTSLSICEVYRKRPGWQGMSQHRFS